MIAFLVNHNIISPLLPLLSYPDRQIQLRSILSLHALTHITPEHAETLNWPRIPDTINLPQVITKLLQESTNINRPPFFGDYHFDRKMLTSIALSLFRIANDIQNPPTFNQFVQSGLLKGDLLPNFHHYLGTVPGLICTESLIFNTFELLFRLCTAAAESVAGLGLTDLTEMDGFIKMLVDCASADFITNPSDRVTNPAVLPAWSRFVWLTIHSILSWLERSDFPIQLKRANFEMILQLLGFIKAAVTPFLPHGIVSQEQIDTLCTISTAAQLILPIERRHFYYEQIYQNGFGDFLNKVSSPHFFDLAARNSLKDKSTFFGGESIEHLTHPAKMSFVVFALTICTQIRPPALGHD